MTKARTTNKRKSGSGRRTSGRFRLSRSWPLWLGGVLVVVVYVALFHHFFVSPLSFRWRAIYGEPDYPEGFQVMGIDVSHHQSRIDWEELRNARIGGHPLRFVFVKATEGITLIDENFNDNFFRSRENGLIRGAYHYYKPGSDARRQAEFFLRQVHLVQGDLPPVVDIEERGSKPLAQFQHDVLTWLRIVEEAVGVPPIIYAGYRFRMDYLSTPLFDRYPLWIAHYYEKSLRYQGAWHFWQFTDCGRVQGISGTVDFNLFNGDLKALMQLTLQPCEDAPPPSLP